MYEGLIKYISEMPDDQVPHVYLENMAVCAAWFDSYRDQPEATEPFHALKQKFDVWVRAVEPLKEETEGFRQQPLLRDLVDEISRGNLMNLIREELDVIHFAWGFMQRTGKPEIFDRFSVMLDPHIKAVSARREELPLCPGIAGLGQRIAIHTTEEIKAAPARDVKIFAGLDAPLRGPLLVCSGDTKIVGDIPDGHGVAVEGGNCTVSGRVNGKLAATNNCEIFGHVAGVVVSRKGTIRARSLLTQSVAVAKEGSLMVTSVEGARTAFGCNTVRVTQGVNSANLSGRHIEIRGDAQGGKIQTSEYLSATRFCNAEKKLAIVLRRGLSPQDYGEVLLIESLRLLTNAIKLRQKLSNLTEMHDLAEREADEYAGNVLVFLVGDEGSASRVSNLQGLQRRHAYMSRLAATAHALVGYIEERIANGPNQESSGAEERALLEDLQRELGMLASEGQVEPAVQEAQRTLINMVKRLGGNMVLPSVLHKLLEEVSNRQREYSVDVARVEALIRKEDDIINSTAGKTAILDKARESGNRVALLNQLIAAARAKMGSTPFHKRLLERYVKIMQRNIEARLAHATAYRAAIRQTEERIEGIRDKLWTEFQISLPLHVLKGWNRDGAKVTGQFDSEVTIASWPHLVEDGRPGELGYLLTPGLGTERISYRRTENGGIERC